MLVRRPGGGGTRSQRSSRRHDVRPDVRPFERDMGHQHDTASKSRGEQASKVGSFRIVDQPVAKRRANQAEMIISATGTGAGKVMASDHDQCQSQASTFHWGRRRYSLCESPTLASHRVPSSVCVGVCWSRRLPLSSTVASGGQLNSTPIAV